MVQISSKIREVDRQLAAEVKTIKNSLKAAYELSLAQENEMKARIETLREEVLDLQKKGIQYNILKREVETNRGLYNSLLQRYKEVDIAGGVGTNNIFIVDKAMVPGAPSEPKCLGAASLSRPWLRGWGGCRACFLKYSMIACALQRKSSNSRDWQRLGLSLALKSGNGDAQRGLQRPAFRACGGLPLSCDRFAVLDRLRFAAVHRRDKRRARRGQIHNGGGDCAVFCANGSEGAARRCRPPQSIAS